LKNQIKQKGYKRKKYRFEKNWNQAWHKRKIKSNHKRWNWKTYSIKKMIRKNKNNNQNNEDQIWCINKMLRDEIEKIISIKDWRSNTCN